MNAPHGVRPVNGRLDGQGRLVEADPPLLRLQEKMKPGESDDIILTCYMSRDFREGMDAFLSKRQPVWSGE